MGRLIDTDAAYATLTEYYNHRTMVQHSGLEEALNMVETTSAITLEWIGEYLAWLKDIGGYGLSDARAIQSMIIKWKMDNEQKHSGCGPDYCEIGG